jgi:serine/threonine protein kinase
MTTPAPASPVHLDTSSHVWAQVTDLLESFAKAWETGGAPPDPAHYLPHDQTATRRLALAELLKLDIDNRLQRGLDRSLEEYFQAFPDLVQAGVPCDLLYEDFHLRRQAGKPVHASDYYRRFPGSAQELARLLGSDAPTHSTSVAATAVRLALLPGDRLDDFDLLTLLGEGQFAKVFLARQRSMQRLVALKVSAARGTEAQTLAQLDHPNIVRVYDQRLLNEQEWQLVYMPYLPGGTLQSVLNRAKEVPDAERSGRTLLEAIDAQLHLRGEVPAAASTARTELGNRSWAATVCSLGAKLASALDYANSRGVLHRDVKPANVLLTAEGEPLLADFNIGCCTKLEGAGPKAIFGGSLPYMSPEHLEAFNPAHPRAPESLDVRADIFSLAVTLWELLASQRPFGQELRSDSWSSMLSELVAQRQAGPKAEAIEAASDDDVPGLREVLLRCLDANPERRPTSAGEMAYELELCLRPATRDLVRPKAGGWRGIIRHYPVVTLLAAGLIPNLFAAAFNIAYNEAEIVRDWKNAQDEFQWLVPTVNGVFFPLGILLVVLSVIPVAGALRRLDAREAFGPADLTRRRLQSLRLGAISAYICVGCWLVAGLIWPIALRAAAAEPPPEGWAAYIHFLLSLLICGLIAAAYPYFVATFIAVRAWYPALLGSEGPNAADGPALRQIEREMARYRAAATAIPLVGVALLASSRAANMLAVAMLCVIGLAGTLLAFALEGRVRADIAALSQVPTRERR